MSTETADAKYDEQWELVMAGLDRAVRWVKEHKDVLLRGGFHLHLNRDTGIEIHFGYLSLYDTEREAALRELFRGRVAQKRISNDEVQYVLRDAGLTFEWSIWRSRVEAKPETIEVTL